MRRILLAGLVLSAVVSVGCGSGSGGGTTPRLADPSNVDPKMKGRGFDGPAQQQSAPAGGAGQLRGNGQ